MVAESVTLAFFQTHGYWILFLLLILDGAIAALAGFAASLGVFDVWIVFVLAFFGGVIPDSFFFFIGKIGRKSVLEKYFGKSKKFRKFENSKIRKALKKNYIEALFAIKFTPYVQIPGFIAAGMSKLDYEKYLPVSITMNLISATVFTFGGYFFGKIFVSILGDNPIYIALAVAFFIAVVSIIIRLYKKFHKWTIKKIEELAINNNNNNKSKK